MACPVPLTTEVWARIRYEYESTTRKVVEICAEHGISEGSHQSIRALHPIGRSNRISLRCIGGHGGCRATWRHDPCLPVPNF